jgi:hypothetical protein
MLGVMALKSITPTFGDLKVAERDASSNKLLRTICTYKWNFAKSYLDSHPEKLSVQVGYNISQWEWWLVRSELGFIQCTLFQGRLMMITPFFDDECYTDIITTPPTSPAIFPTPLIL